MIKTVDTTVLWEAVHNYADALANLSEDMSDYTGFNEFDEALDALSTLLGPDPRAEGNEE